VMQRIKATAHRPAGGSDPRVGAGVVDFLAAVSTDSPMTDAPSPTRTSAPVAVPPLPSAPDHRARDTALTGAAACGGLLAVMLCVRAIPTRLRRMPPGYRNILND
jgi:membrane-anchored mycosin MYCP